MKNFYIKKILLASLVGIALLSVTPSVLNAAGTGSCDLNTNPPTSTNTETYICTADTGGLPAGCKAVDSAGGLDQGFTCTTVPTGYTPPSDDPLNCSDTSSHPGTCPSGYSCAHQSGGAGMCIVGSGANQCSGTNPSGTINSSTSTIQRSCSCEYKGGSYAWLCADSVQGKAPQCGPRPDNPLSCICQFDSKGQSVWQCDSVNSTTPPAATTQTPASNCTNGNCNLDYKLLEPLPGLENVKNLNFASFLGVIFKLAITFGALVSVGTLVFAGISYMVSDAVGEVGEARKRMKASIFGMLILLGSWLLLNTINPQLLNFDLSSIGTLNKAANTPSTSTSGGAGPDSAGLKDCTSQPGYSYLAQSDGSYKCTQN